jgi:hypothetical protein
MEQKILSREDRFADYLAKEYSIPEIRQIMNLTNSQAQSIMRRIRGQLGPQAV